MSKRSKRKYAQEQKYNAVIAGIASLFLINILAVYPLFIWRAGYFDLTFEKTFFFWLTTGIAVLAMLFMLVCVKGKFYIADYYAPNEPVRRLTVAEWALFGFIFWAFLSAVISATTNWFGTIVWFGAENRYEGFVSFLAYAACFFIIARFYKPRRLHLLLAAVGAALVSLIGVLQFFGADIFGLFPFDMPYPPLADEHGNRLHGPLSAFFRTTLGNVNIVSAYCSFAVILFAALFSVSRASRRQYLYLGAGALSFALSLTTGFSGDAHVVAISGAMLLLVPYWITSRERFARILIVLATWLALYAGHSAYMSAMKRRLEAGEHFYPFERQLLYEHSHANIALLLSAAAALLAAGLLLLLLLKKWLPARPLKIAAVAVLPAVIISGAIGLEILGRRLADEPHNFIWQAREMMHGRFDDTFGSGRGWVWRNALEVIPDNPVFGTGPDTFFFALGESPNSPRHMESAALLYQTFDKAHNIFLQIAVCMGIPALLAYIIFIAGVLVPAVKPAFNRPVLLAFGAASLSYMLQSFFAVEVPITTPIVWICLGVVAGETWMSKIGRESLEV